MSEYGFNYFLSTAPGLLGEQPIPNPAGLDNYDYDYEDSLTRNKNIAGPMDAYYDPNFGPPNQYLASTNCESVSSGPFYNSTSHAPGKLCTTTHIPSNEPNLNASEGFALDPQLLSDCISPDLLSTTRQPSHPNSNVEPPPESGHDELELSPLDVPLESFAPSQSPPAIQLFQPNPVQLEVPLSFDGVQNASQPGPGFYPFTFYYHPLLLPPQMEGAPNMSTFQSNPIVMPPNFSFPFHPWSNLQPGPLTSHVPIAAPPAFIPMFEADTGSDVPPDEDEDDEAEEDVESLIKTNEEGLTRYKAKFFELGVLSNDTMECRWRGCRCVPIFARHTDHIDTDDNYHEQCVSHLLSHVKIDFDRRWRCHFGTCTKVFRDKRALERHLFTAEHVGARTYCPVKDCRASCSRQTDTRSHIQKVHGVIAVKQVARWELDSGARKGKKRTKWMKQVQSEATKKRARQDEEDEEDRPSKKLRA